MHGLHGCAANGSCSEVDIRSSSLHDSGFIRTSWVRTVAAEASKMKASTIAVALVALLAGASIRRPLLQPVCRTTPSPSELASFPKRCTPYLFACVS